ncbi:hypothetical protein TWF970_001375 [Orbilia oligospora]|uniref:Uncharacterized protein n=1 Tax=Orbilia oligospora TaxID=2813651 RepID=A0A7C8VS99_ORBOL|nr:hypothetical protein TWF970_001375 [Orbilia oligospora]
MRKVLAKWSHRFSAVRWIQGHVFAARLCNCARTPLEGVTVVHLETMQVPKQKQQQQISAIKQYFVSRSTSATAFSIPYAFNDTTTTFTASSPRPSSSPHQPPSSPSITSYHHRQL